jgi:chemotaxis protein CheX
VKAEYVNLFLSSASSVMGMVCGEEPTFGQPFLRQSPYPIDDLNVIIGVTGKLRGQMIMSLNQETAKNVASRMMGGMEVLELDEICLSAIGELGNMIAGNAARLLGEVGVSVDIAPPAVLEGKGVKVSNQIPTLSIPLSGEFGPIEVALSLAD